jgi:cation diffusion facilitator family transporter
MHAQTIETYRHEHMFLGASHARNERKTWVVIGVCGTMMAAEIGGGALFGSMALIADGLHMSTHAAALLIAALAYTFARRHVRDERFSFGTGKFGELAAFTSAIVLAMVALLIGYESVLRFLHPVRIAFAEAIPIAVLGLGVNVLSAWLLRDAPHDHGHHHAHDDHDEDHDHHPHDHHHHDRRDLNLRAAYVHVMADAAISVLAIVGLTSAKVFGWVWMDPAMGIVGAIVIANWSFGLVRAAGAVLLDMQPGGGLAHEIEHRLEKGSDRVSDLHLWRVGPGHNAAVVSLVTDHPEPPEAYKAKLAGLAGLSHVTVEVHACPGEHPPRPANAMA